MGALRASLVRGTRARQVQGTLQCRSRGQPKPAAVRAPRPASCSYLAASRSRDRVRYVKGTYCICLPGGSHAPDSELQHLYLLSYHLHPIQYALHLSWRARMFGQTLRWVSARGPIVPIWLRRLIPLARQQTLRHNVKDNKIDQLKQILSAFNKECGTNHTKTGRKQDLVDKITRSLDEFRQESNQERWSQAKAIMDRVRTNS